MEAFWMDARIRAAKVEHEKEKHDEIQENQNTAGTATPREKRKLHQQQEQRADRREAMQQAGKQTPTPDGQLDLLDQRKQDLAAKETAGDIDLNE